LLLFFSKKVLRVNLVKYLSGNIHIVGSANVKLKDFIDSATKKKAFPSASFSITFLQIHFAKDLP